MSEQICRLCRKNSLRYCEACEYDTVALKEIMDLKERLTAVTQERAKAGVDEDEAISDRDTAISQRDYERIENRQLRAGLEQIKSKATHHIVPGHHCDYSADRQACADIATNLLGLTEVEEGRTR